VGVIIRASYVKVGLHLQIRAFDRLPLLFAEPRPARQLSKRKEGNELTSSDGQCPVPRRSDARVGLTKQHDSSIAIFFYNAVRTNARTVIHDGVSAIYLRALYVGMTTLTCGDEQFCIRKGSCSGRLPHLVALVDGVEDAHLPQRHIVPHSPKMP
jgi:hypothetical protein